MILVTRTRIELIFLLFVVISNFVRFYAAFEGLSFVDLRLFKTIFSNHKGQIKDRL